LNGNGTQLKIYRHLWIIYTGDVILVKTLATATEYVLALATLGDTTRNRDNPHCVVQPKVAKARTMVSVTCHCRWHYHNKLSQCKHDFTNPALIVELVQNCANRMRLHCYDIFLNPVRPKRSELEWLKN